MDNQPPKSARDEILEAQARDRPPKDAFREHERLVQAMLRMLGRSDEAHLPHEPQRSNAITPERGEAGVTLEDLGAPELPAPRIDRESPPSDVPWGDFLPRLLPHHDHEGEPIATNWRAIVPKDAVQPAPRRDTKDGREDSLRGDPAPNNALRPQQLKDEFRDVSLDRQPSEPSMQPDTAGSMSAWDLPKQSDRSGNSALGSFGDFDEPSDDPATDDSPPDDTARRIGHVSPNSDVESREPSSQATTVPPASMDRSNGLIASPTAPDAMPTLPPFPILLVQLEDPSALIRAEVEALAEEIERLASDIAQERVDDYAFLQFARSRALNWHG